jgi:hypothetical protein
MKHLINALPLALAFSVILASGSIMLYAMCVMGGGQ